MGGENLNKVSYKEDNMNNTIHYDTSSFLIADQYLTLTL